MTFSTHNPFTDPAPNSVSLVAPPLSGVLVQISFPEILSIADKYYVGEFQDRIRSEYPFNLLNQNVTIKSLNETPSLTQTPNWRFFDESRYWRVSLSTSFLAIETRKYSGRENLIQRVTDLVDALFTTVKPEFLTRLGVRYVDRMHGKPLENIVDYVRPEVLGMISSDLSKHVNQASSEFMAETDYESLIARFGYMPPNQTHNPELMPAIDIPSWYLDTDVFHAFDQPVEFANFNFPTKVLTFASRAYSFFRWVVNDDFLQLYGGEV